MGHKLARAFVWHIHSLVQTAQAPTQFTMSNNFDSQASTNYKEAFALFDKRGNGRVTVDSLGDLLRACGQNPTLSEIEDLKRSAGGSDFDFPTFTSILNRPN